MSFLKTGVKSSALLVALMVMSLAANAFAQQSKLGSVEFPNSGSEKAQANFLRGLAALHSFWYEEALDEFRAATKIDPDFMMAYWGEAMAHNHPLWSEQDAEAARKVIANIKDSPKLSARERAYLNAVKTLYGEGDKLARDIAYAEAMEKIYRDYPDDLEAASFYSLALQGMVRPGDRGFRRQMKSGAIAAEVYQKNPNHPGAAHYIIHAFDDPEHAILALPAARRYAEIAPEAHHARHMPSHIFVQLGMWPEAAASNESSWAVSDAWVKRKGHSITRRDYHSLQWLLYVYLQQGRQGKAEELLSLMRKTVQEMPDAPRLKTNYDMMAATFVVETERWDQAAKLLSKTEPKPEAKEASGEHAMHGAAPKPAEPKPGATSTPNTYRPRRPAWRPFVWGLASASGALSEMDKSVAELQAIRKELADAGEAYTAKRMEIMELEVSAQALSMKGKHEEAIEMMKRATALEEEMSPPSGPPELLKPSHEVYGEVLLRAGRAKEAAQQFATSLLRQPNRARSLLGAARAAARSGDTKGAATAYSALLRVWAQGDSQLPELREAQDYLKQASAR
jgi:tetratricopeptide (TPR) repeat protein